MNEQMSSTPQDLGKLRTNSTISGVLLLSKQHFPHLLRVSQLTGLLILTVHTVIYSTTLSHIPDYCLSKGLDHSGGHDIFILCFKRECEKLTSSHHWVICEGCLTHVWHCVKKAKLEACHVVTQGPKQSSCIFLMN